MKKVININDKWQIFLKILLFISLPALSLFLCRNTEKWIMIISLVASIICSFVLVKFIFKDIFKKIDLFYAVISFLLSDYIINVYYMYHKSNVFISNFYSFSSLNLIILAFFSIFALMVIIYLGLRKLVPILKESYKNLSKFEKIYLILISIGGFILSAIIYNLTSVFYFHNSINYDLVYTSDSSVLFKGDAFFNINMPENDLRQPFFGIFALPFSLIAKLLSNIFFFIPNGYAIFLTTVQIFLLGVTTIMLARLFKLDEKHKFNLILLYLSAFSSIVFAFILEQYIIGLFYLILTIYVYYYIKPKVNYTYIASVGTLLTSGICFPFISKFKNFKSWFKNVFKCFLFFVFILIIFGQLGQIFDLPDMIEHLFGFTGEKLSFSEKFMQFLTFIKNIFFTASANVSNALGYPGYYLNPVYHYSKLGIIILIICFISFILNRKNKMAVISFSWIIFSFFLLCVLGWGTAENGLILYSLYFSWAYIGLVYLFIVKIFKNPKVLRIIVLIFSLILLAVNIPEFINIVKFGVEYYPL